MNILFLEPFYGGSHKKWLDGLVKNSLHNIKTYTLPDRFWKWRMHGAALHFAQKYNEDTYNADLILASDMLDLSTFLSLTRKKTTNTKTAVYFHENQLTYPWSPTDEDTQLKRDRHYAFINITSALSANAVLFNSNYHKNSFLNEIPKFLNAFPDYQETWVAETIAQKSKVLHLGMNLQKLQNLKPTNLPYHNRAVVLWNHRWEYDKNPTDFFESLITLHHNGIDFKLIVLGEKTNTYPPIFDEAKEILKDKILHWGYVESEEEYISLLWQSDILPVTSNQDFFGGSVVEAMACNVFPLLPNRLAYAEHIPPAYAKTFTYDNLNNFVKRLQRLIFDVKIIRKQNIQQWVMHYDWNNCIKTYDKAFEESVSK